MVDAEGEELAAKDSLSCSDQTDETTHPRLKLARAQVAEGEDDDQELL